MSDRLKELQRQRALMQEHLGWLDREIAAASGPSPLPPAPAPPSPDQAAAAAEQILSQYQVETQSVKSNVKRGCFLYFFLAFVLVGLGLWALYLHSVRK